MGKKTLLIQKIDLTTRKSEKLEHDKSERSKQVRLSLLLTLWARTLIYALTHAEQRHCHRGSYFENYSSEHNFFYISRKLKQFQIDLLSLFFLASTINKHKAWFKNLISRKKREDKYSSSISNCLSFHLM